MVVFICNSVYAQDARMAEDSVFADSAAIDSLVHEAPIKPSKTALQREQFKFVLYLISSELYDDALHVLKDMRSDTVKHTNLRDSVTYYIGWIKYFNQDFDGAIENFSRIDSSSDVMHASAFYNAICFVQFDSLTRAKHILNQIDVSSDDQLQNLKLLQLQGLALLERDYVAFDSLAHLVNVQSFITQTEMAGMKDYAELMRTYKRKSPWIAGLLSAIIPGAGKFYAGYRGVPFGAMYMTIPLGAIAAESLILAGVASAQFIALGALFGVFYVGNIWGSVLSVYAKEREFYDEMDHNIEFDMHSPVRRAFY